MVALLVIASVVFLVVPRPAYGLRRLDGQDHPGADMCCIACTRRKSDETPRLGKTDIIESVEKMPPFIHDFFFCLFSFCGRPATVSSFVFYSGKVLQNELEGNKKDQAIHSSNCFLYLGIQSSVPLSDPIRRRLI